MTESTRQYRYQRTYRTGLRNGEITYPKTQAYYRLAHPQEPIKPEIIPYLELKNSIIPGVISGSGPGPVYQRQYKRRASVEKKVEKAEPVAPAAPRQLIRRRPVAEAAPAAPRQLIRRRPVAEAAPVAEPRQIIRRRPVPEAVPAPAVVHRKIMRRVR